MYFCYIFPVHSYPPFLGIEANVEKYYCSLILYFKLYGWMYPLPELILTYICYVTIYHDSCLSYTYLGFGYIESFNLIAFSVWTVSSCEYSRAAPTRRICRFPFLNFVSYCLCFRKMPQSDVSRLLVWEEHKRTVFNAEKM